MVFECVLYVLLVFEGMCEMVMVRDDVPKDLLSSGVLNAYPGAEDSDEEDLDAMSESYDIQMGNNKVIDSMAMLRLKDIMQL